MLFPAEMLIPDMLRSSDTVSTSDEELLLLIADGDTDF